MLWPASVVRSEPLSGFSQQYYPVSVKATATTAVMEHHDQGNLWRKRLIWLILPHHCSSSEASLDRNSSGQEHEGAADAEAMLTLMACSSIPPAQGCHSPPPHTLAYSQILWRHFLT